MTSIKASELFKDNTVDYIYIDGDHSLGFYDDLRVWIPKIRIGGILSGHDFKCGPRSGISNYFGKQLDYEIEKVVRYYCDRFGFKLNIVGGRILNWWFIKNTELPK